MKRLGLTGLLELDDEAEWQQVRTILFATGFTETTIGNGSFLQSCSGMIVTDREFNSHKGVTSLGRRFVDARVLPLLTAIPSAHNLYLGVTND